jgi:hypothetical protein
LNPLLFAADKKRMTKIYNCGYINFKQMYTTQQTLICDLEILKEKMSTTTLNSKDAF